MDFMSMREPASIILIRPTTVTEHFTKMNRISRIYRPVTPVLGKTKSVAMAKNQNLLIEHGLMKPLTNGIYYYLPLLQRSIEKTSKLIGRCMNRVGAQHITIPILTPANLWKVSDRFSQYENVLFHTKDKTQHDFILGPTFEEATAKMLNLTGGNIGEEQLPLRFYQIGNKFRDEDSPRYGLIRTREFIMKDLYTFDIDKKHAMQTYDEISEMYGKLFKYLEISFTNVEAEAEEMGGHLSHEYHYMNQIGDEKLITCSRCSHSMKDTGPNEPKCAKCKGTSFEKHRGIEVGHTFYLGDTFTKKLKANYLTAAGKAEPMQMGCHGIGVTRLIGASLECLSTDVHLRWPFAIAPFSVCIVTPEKRSKAFTAANHFLDEVYHNLNALPGLQNDVVVDDRIKLTPNDRIRQAKRIGIPLIVIIGRKACDPENVQFELYITQEDKTCFLPMNELIAEISKIVQKYNVEF